VAVTAPHPVTAEAVARRLKGGKADVSGVVFRILLIASLAFSLLVLVVLVWSQVTGGWDVLSGRLGDFLTSKNSRLASRSGIVQGLTGTLTIGLFVAGIAFPLGVGAAIYLEEYAPRSRLTRYIDVNIRNLAGVPSIVYGILGLAIFVKGLGDITGGRSLLAAGTTLAILALPIVIITSSEAIRAVPDSIREAGFGVGATKWEVIRSHVLPYAAPGILTGTMLALARALGEAAPLILVGAVTGFFTGGEFGDVRGSFTAMPVQLFYWAKQPSDAWRTNTAAGIVVLLVVVLAINSAAIALRNVYEKKR
jgi:phosphate transport system permease protein